MDKSSTVDSSQSFETITSNVRIASHLKPLENKTDILDVKILNSTSSHKSTMLKVDTEHNKLVLDRLIPSDGHELLINSRQITVHASHKGAEINFTTSLINAEPERILPHYEFSFPDSIEYILRRNTYRVTVRNDNETNVEIVSNDNQCFQGELHNISTEGMCIRFPKEIDIPQTGDPTEVQCIVTLPDNQELKCTFNIRHTYHHDHSKEFRIGGNFQYLDKIQKRAIEKFVVELQRKARKTMVR